MLNHYKSEGDGKNILETFKVRRAQLQAEEERQREAFAHRGSHIGGPISTFRFGFGHLHDSQPSTAVESDSSGSSSRDSESSPSDQSLVQWIGSWIGWK